MSSPLKGYTVRGYSDLCYIFSLYKLSQASEAKMLSIKACKHLGQILWHKYNDRYRDTLPYMKECL